MIAGSVRLYSLCAHPLFEQPLLHLGSGAPQYSSSEPHRWLADMTRLMGCVLYLGASVAVMPNDAEPKVLSHAS